MDGARPWWADKEPNFARLQMSVVRREVILGRDEVLKVECEKLTKGTEGKPNEND